MQDRFYERSSPIETTNGIKAKSKRGAFSSSWWGKRWIQALESFQDSARLGRGRTYARKGQVLSIDITRGVITAKVQGSRLTPYKVRIEMDILSETSWQLVIDALSKKAIYTARLLAGELPPDIEEIFAEVRIQLLPSHHSHLQTDCSCPDWSNPCKHVAAALYLLAEEFDRDPFLLFKVRGMDKQTFLRNLEKQAIPTTTVSTCTKASTPLSSESFWEGQTLSDDWLQEAFSHPSQQGILIKGLGKFPFWRGENDLQTTLQEIYATCSAKILSML